MKSPMSCLRRLLCEENGNDLVEYGLLAAFISIVSLVTIRLIGPLVNDLFVVVYNNING
jgi:Flp pilus assembly pilin Flp